MILALQVILYTLLSFVGLIVLFLALSYLYTLTIDTKRDYDKSYAFARFASYIICWMSFFFTRSHVKVYGAEKLPKNSRFVLVSNHLSNYDPMLAFYAFPGKRLSFISKASNFKMPFIGRLIRKCCFMSIDREDPRSAITTIDRAVRLLSCGEVSVGIYPEGTRSQTGELGEFHSFVFRIPVKAQVPVAVAYTTGTNTIRKNFPWKSSKVTIEVLEVLDSEYVCTHRPVEISQRVEAIIRARIEEGER